MDPKIFDKAGNIWEIDKEKKKIRRIVEKVVSQGMYKFQPGEIVNYDGGMFITKAKVLRKTEDGLYEIMINNEKLKVPEDTLF